MQLSKKIIELEETSREQQLVMDWQKEFILALKDKINPEPIKSEAIDWISSISEKQFDKAYLKSTTLCKFWEIVGHQNLLLIILFKI